MPGGMQVVAPTTAKEELCVVGGYVDSPLSFLKVVSNEGCRDLSSNSSINNIEKLSQVIIDRYNERMGSNLESEVLVESRGVILSWNARITDRYEIILAIDSCISRSELEEHLLESMSYALKRLYPFIEESNDSFGHFCTKQNIHVFDIKAALLVLFDMAKENKSYVQVDGKLACVAPITTETPRAATLIAHINQEPTAIVDKAEISDETINNLSECLLKSTVEGPGVSHFNITSVANLELADVNLDDIIAAKQALIQPTEKQTMQVDQSLPNKTETEREALQTRLSETATDEELLEAAKTGSVSLVSQILKYTATSIDCQNQDGRTPLMWACIKGHEPVAYLLLSKGAHINIQDNFGYSALIHACSRSHAAVATMLISRGADLNSKSYSGKTSLMYACENGLDSVVHQLIVRKADLFAVSNSGWTAMMYAKEKNYASIIAQFPKESTQIPEPSSHSSDTASHHVPRATSEHSYETGHALPHHVPSHAVSQALSAGHSFDQHPLQYSTDELSQKYNSSEPHPQLAVHHVHPIVAHLSKIPILKHRESNHLK